MIPKHKDTLHSFSSLSDALSLSLQWNAAIRASVDLPGWPAPLLKSTNDECRRISW